MLVWVYTFQNTTMLKIIIEPWHEISNNVVCTTSKASDQPAHTRSLIRGFASRLNIRWLLSYWLNLIWSLCLAGGCTGSSESALVKMPHCWKSHVAAQMSSAMCHQFALQKRPCSTQNEPWHVIYNNVVIWHLYTQTSLCSLVLSLETPNAFQSVAKHS